MGSTSLTVPDPLQATLQSQLPNAAANNAAGVTARNNLNNAINSGVTPLELRIQRDKGSVDYVYNPTSDIDIKVEYSHERRKGERPMGINYWWAAAGLNGFPANIVEVPAPIADTTQNFAVTGQMVGTTPWNQRWVGSLKYGGSLYRSDFDQFEVENPFCLTCNPLAGASRGPNLLRMSNWPDNQAHYIQTTNLVELPFKSRLVHTFQYNMMRQDEDFVNTAINGLVPAPFPAQSLNAKVDTVLSNTVLTTQIAPDLKSTIRHRYYDIDNRTPELLFDNYVRSDSGFVNTPRRAIALQYTKQNANADLVWRPIHWLSVGSSYGFERIDRSRRAVNTTDEHSGKLFVDAAMTDWARGRASVYHSQRRYDQYDEFQLAEIFMGLTAPGQLPQMRKFDMANRDRTKLEASVEFTAAPGLTIVPNGGIKNDDFPEDVFNQLGVSRDNSWNAGVEAIYVVHHGLKLHGSYNFEDRELKMADCCGGAPNLAAVPAFTWRSDIDQRYHTFLGRIEYDAIPDKLNLSLEYVHSLGSESNFTLGCASGATGCTTNPQFPDEKTRFQRLSAVAKYTVDPDVVRALGWVGTVVTKVRYTYERNRTQNWAIDDLTPYVGSLDTPDLTGANRSFFLAAINPNYNVHLIAASLAFKW